MQTDDSNKNMQWWVVNITSGFEQKIKNTIENQDSLKNIPKKIIVPTVKRKKHIRDKMFSYSEKIFPGYVFIACEPPNVETIFSAVVSIPGILNMSCIKGMRRYFDSINDEEMLNVFELISEHKEKAREKEGDPLIKTDSRVRVVDGPFSSFQGIVIDVNRPTNKEAKVKISGSIMDGGITTIVIPLSFVEAI